MSTPTLWSRARRIAAGTALVVMIAGCAEQSTDAGSAGAEPTASTPATQEPEPPSPSTSPLTTTTPQPTGWDQPDVAQPLPASEPARVEIPAINVAEDTVSLGLKADGSMQVPAGAEPIGWFDRSPTPGEIGPAVLAGHVTWNGTDGVFRDLGRLTGGDRITVTRADGSTAEFEVTRVDQYDQDDFPTARVYGNTTGPELRLITCSGDYDQATRSFTHNTVVYATMTNA